ncbi:metallophosphoesterase [Anaeromyxobacter dehalogenans 2CP-1]|uniref:Metallophosphoesterase n=1 Tax=Anaeromyxobacter dehalogenans (strain ATCC BAA-258 / DSM 21875 / 2CP-1) TaxID=455488 RepID=B8JFS9_ANAD2|nr:TIGR00282 family metallophosphoesterase [Anaeromyxobacter dehalogenans]ACL64517.1 metallophosphoesterase [Anaeromyxobacter dehalogenans 2CP-1]
MKVLFLGDVFGKPGRQAIQRLVPRLIVREAIDLVVANAENSAGGAGVTPDSADELLAAEVDLLTSGNHIWSKREIVSYLEAPGSRLLRPANYPPGSPGRGRGIASTPDGRRLGVVNVEGRVFMKTLDDPFRTALAEVEALRAEGVTCILVDMHCEATSEKNAMGWFLDGKVSAVLGTHTHVQTADARVLPGGTAFVTDVGMCGPWDSVIGVKKELVLERFLTQRHVGFEPARRDVYLQGAIVDLDDATGRARSIARVQEKLEE